MKQLAVLFALLCVQASPEEIDRICVVVGNQVITASQLSEEMRVTAFLNKEHIDESVSQRRSAANRLIDQVLIEREMRLTRYVFPPDSAATAQLSRVRQQFQDDSDFSATLAAYHLTVPVLQEHLRLQVAMLQFIAFRFASEAAERPNEAGDALDVWLKQARAHTAITYVDVSLRPQPSTAFRER